MNGYIDHKSCTIFIDGALDPIVEKTIVLHEILHGIMYNSGVAKETDDVHQAIDTFGTCLIAIIHENKKLIEWFKEKK